MALSKTKYFVLAAAVAIVPLLIGAACSGGDFSATVDSDAGNPGGSTSSGGSGNPTGGSAGSGSIGSGGSSTGVMCQGPEDCNDPDPCMVDSCGNGECLATPKCEEPLKCCAGECGQCCADTDCNDSVDCTNDRCFAGSCTHVVDDSKCPDGSYCSMTGGCREKEPCTGEVEFECEDGDPCTTDACVNLLCDHPTCADPMICCAGIGCGMCCADSQCADPDPCTVDSCSGGSCQNRPLCEGDGVQCCVSADGSSASCGLCCSAGECDDQVDCTDDACAQGSCQNTPNNDHCDNGMVCDVARDCITAPQCNGNADCNDNIGCTVDACINGRCSFNPDDSQCQGGTCSIQHGGCVQCTEDFQCNDGSDCTFDVCNRNTFTCTYSDGACGNLYCCGNRCQECCSADQCDGLGKGGGANILPPDGGVDNLCLWYTCSDEGKCIQQSDICDFAPICCPGIGCVLDCPLTQ